MNRLIALVAALLLLTSCTGNSAAPVPSAERASATPWRAIVDDPDAVLLGVRVAGSPGDRSVTSAWKLDRRRMILHSDDGFESAHAVRWTPRTAEKWLPSGTRWQRPGLVGLDGLQTWAAPEIGREGVAVLGGGDGATLFPFEKVARFDGRRWTAYDVETVTGQQAYTNGGVVLPDGRLLLLLDHWSGDRPRMPVAVWHGLWISTGDDWTQYRPWRPRFRPVLTQPEWGSPLVSLGGSAGPHGVLWVRTWDDRAYASEDGKTFEEITIR